jgi:hypothetical protein
MKHLYILIVCASLNSFAQDARQQARANEERQAANKEFNEHLNRVYENNLPNKKGTTYSALTPAEIEATWKGGKKMTETERYNAATGPLKTVYDEEKGDYVYVHSPRSIIIEAAESKMLDALMHSVAEKKHLYLSDKIAWYKDAYFGAAMDIYEVKPLDYEAASDAVLAFTSTNGTASYQSLYDLVWKARILPMSARNMILFLYEKFPDQRANTELLELKQLPYFFGAGRPYLNHRWGDLKDYTNNPYPGCFYEYTNTSPAMRSEILQRFIELADKYPEEGLIAAGFCRSHINPFTLYAETNSGLTDAQKEDYYWKAIHIKRALPDVDYESSIIKTDYIFLDGGNDYVFLLLKKPLTWLIEKREGRIKSLSPADWKEISDRTATFFGDIRMVRIFVKGKYFKEEVLLTKKYKNFKIAYDNDKKEIHKKIEEQRKKQKS